MKIETTLHGLTASLSPTRASRKIIGFVPTMGNLHEGHLTLVREAKQLCDVVVVSIFVNPIQFGPNEDFENYPRTLEQDSRLLADAGCDILFTPTTEQMYGTQPRLTHITVSGVTQDLCGQSREGHFDGVAVVVTKLFNMVQPKYAFFGEKDYQQLVVIRQLVQDLNIPLEVIGVPIVRAEDGLALSSRNGYLTAQERETAPKIYKSLQQAAYNLQKGQSLDLTLNQIKQTLKNDGFEIDYVEARTPTLQVIEFFEQDILIFVAAKLGKTRLIDNLYVIYTKE